MNLFQFTLPSLVIFGLILLPFLVGYLAFRLQTKRFYILRHGRTFLNEAEIKQGEDGGLSEAGIKQAQHVGGALAKIEDFPIQEICSSPYLRAKQTADIVNSYLKVPISTTPLLAERRNPSEVIGKKVDDPEVQKITGLIEKGFHDNNYRYSDEENFTDLTRRAQKALSYLERRNTRVVCIVTHHAFLQVFLSYLLYRNQLDEKNYAKLAFFNPASNAGITICEYRPWLHWFSKTRGWSILAYNETVT